MNLEFTIVCINVCYKIPYYANSIDKSYSLNMKNIPKYSDFIQ